MYAMVEADYSLADIERFVELSIRRGIGFSSLARLDAGAGDVRVAAGAALLGVAADAPIARAALRRALGAFLSGPGDWLAESVEALEAKLFEIGLLALDAAMPADPDDSPVRSRLLPRPGVTARRLVDELEAAREVLARRRALRRTALQTKNREVNSAAPEVDQEADLRFMRMALDAAREAAAADEVPVGAVLTQGDAVLAVTNNRTLRDRDPSAHAEMLALREGARKLGNHRLTETTLYVTLEPCPMCAGAIAEARCRRVVFGAADERRGAIQSALRLFELPGVNHRPFVASGLLEEEASALLRDFFAAKRKAGAAEIISNTNSEAAVPAEPIRAVSAPSSGKSHA